MACKNCKQKNCGCSEKGIIIPEYSHNEATKEQCSEVFYDSCVMRGQVDMIASINNNIIEIKKGDRLDTIIQKLLCSFINEQQPETAIVNFKIVSYSEDSVDLAWDNENKYDLELLVSIDNIPQTIEIGSVDRYTLNNLEKAEYQFTIINRETNAKSVTLKLIL